MGFFSSVYTMLLPDTFYVRHLKKKSKEEPIGKPILVGLFAFLSYAIAGAVLAYCVYTYSGMETSSTEFTVASTTVLEKEGYTCDMISSTASGTSFGRGLYKNPPYGNEKCWPTVTPACEFPLEVAYQKIATGTTATLSCQDMSINNEKTSFVNKEACLSFAQSDKFWDSCTVSPFSCGDVTAEFNGIKFELSCAAASQDDAASVKAEMRATHGALLAEAACGMFPFPPYACVKTTKEKTFTWLGVASLSIANTELVFGLACALFGALLMGDVKKAAETILKGEDAVKAVDV